MELLYRSFTVLCLFALCSCPVASDDSSDKLQRLFDMSFEELLNIEVQVASNIIKEARKQPVAVTTLNQDKIRASGARTLNEVLMTYIPGYFLVEDQDDTIAAFRGLVPDNNSKVLFLLNGHSINAEFFWGPPDALLNGLDINFIERIEVIRGPGSASLGQGALMGVINIVTKSAKDSEHGVEVFLSGGDNQLNRQSLSFALEKQDHHLLVYLGNGQFEGEPIRNEGWAANKIEQGLSVYQRNHFLKRSEYSHFFAQYSTHLWRTDLFQFEQKRDLYNFYRDREVVEQRLQGILSTRQFELTGSDKLEISAHIALDDYALYSHGENLMTMARFDYESTSSPFQSIYNTVPGLSDQTVASGLIMGGTREKRRGIKALYTYRDERENNQIALGLEYNQFSSGLANRFGHNFIINEEIQALGLRSNGTGGIEAVGSVNENNPWVKPRDIEIGSVFYEHVYKANEYVTVFGALRFDNHPNWGAQTTPRLGLNYSPNSRHYFRLSWQEGFRGAVGVQYNGGFVQDGLLAESNFEDVNAVSDSEVDFDFNGIGSDDDGQLYPLKPETIESLELAWLGSPDKDTRYQVTVFLNSLENILVAKAHAYENLNYGDSIGTDQVGTWGGNWYYQNLGGNLKQGGVEIEADWKWSELTVSTSHSHVKFLSANTEVQGMYITDQKKFTAYPNDVTRVQLSWAGSDQWTAHYNHLYFREYFSPTNVKVNGSHLGALIFDYFPKWNRKLLFQIQVKNLWDQNKLYPFISTGDLSGNEGTPALEGRTWWLSLSYQI